MLCTKCGVEIPEDSHYCLLCGAKIEATNDLYESRGESSESLSNEVLNEGLADDQPGISKQPSVDKNNQDEPGHEYSAEDEVAYQEWLDKQPDNVPTKIPIKIFGFTLLAIFTFSIIIYGIFDNIQKNNEWRKEFDKTNPAQQISTTDKTLNNEQVASDAFMDKYGAYYTEEARKRVKEYMDENLKKDKTIRENIDKYIENYGELYGYNGYHGSNNKYGTDQKETYWLHFITGYEFKYIPQEEGSEDIAKIIAIKTNLTYEGLDNNIEALKRIAGCFKDALYVSGALSDIYRIYIVDKYGQTLKMDMFKG